MRGSGESDGLLHDEYLPLEQDDALEVIDWIARQPWCSGPVGMMGKSWGAFNSLQVAARRPPALKAIIAVMGTDDRYAEDVHYSGGCLLNDNFWWGCIMQVFNARPPDPEIVGERWRAMWLERLQAETFWPQIWLEHQRSMTTGSTARCASTIRRSPVPYGAGAAGRISIATHRSDSPRTSRYRTKSPSAPGRTSTPTRRFRAPRSGSCRKRCAGGITGSRVRTVDSCKSRRCGST